MSQSIPSDNVPKHDETVESEGVAKVSKNPIKKMWSTLSRKMSFSDKPDKEHQQSGDLLSRTPSVRSIRQSFEPSAKLRLPPVVTPPKGYTELPPVIPEKDQRTSHILTPPKIEVEPPVLSPKVTNIVESVQPVQKSLISPPKPPRTFQMGLPSSFSRSTLDDDAQNLHEVFKVFSFDSTTLTLDNVPTVVRIAGLTPTEAQLKPILDGWRKENKTSVTFDELHKGYQTLSANPELKPGSINDFVGLLDNFVYDGRGNISEPELRFLLGRGEEGLSAAEINELIGEVGVNDSNINVADFARAIMDEKQ